MENLDAWELWQGVATQWRASGFGLIGLDYPSVRFVAGIYSIHITEDVLQKLQLLEAWTLSKHAETAKTTGSA